MGKGSNIRPRKVPKEKYDQNWEKIFGEWKNSPLRGVKKSDTQPAVTGNKQDAKGRHTV